MKTKNLGDVWVYNNMYIYIMPSEIYIVLINKKIAIERDWFILHPGLLAHVMEEELGRERNL